jgi:hypothetical protein
MERVGESSSWDLLKVSLFN